MASYVKFQQFVEDLAHKVHDLSNDTLKVYLTNATPSASADAVKADLAEISAGNGYTAGGNAAAFSSGSQSGGTYTLVLTDPATWTASGGSIGPFRYAVLYNDTPSSPLDPLIAYWDYGSALTVLDGESFTVDFGASVLTIA